MKVMGILIRKKKLKDTRTHSLGVAEVNFFLNVRSWQNGETRFMPRGNTECFCRLADEYPFCFFKTKLTLETMFPV